MKKAVFYKLVLTIAISLFTFSQSTFAGSGYNPDATIKIGSMTPPVSLNNVGGAGQGMTEAFYRNVYEPLMVLEDDGTNRIPAHPPEHIPHPCGSIGARGCVRHGVQLYRD